MVNGEKALSTPIGGQNSAPIDITSYHVQSLPARMTSTGAHNAGVGCFA